MCVENGHKKDESGKLQKYTTNTLISIVYIQNSYFRHTLQNNEKWSKLQNPFVDPSIKIKNSIVPYSDIRIAPKP